MSTKHDYLVTVTIDGAPIGVFDSRTGGETDSDITKRNTGTGPKVYASRSATGDVTVVRGYERERDHELARGLERRAGRALMTVSEQPLDEDGNPWGKPKVWSGVLKSVDSGEVDSDSEDPRDLTLVMVARTVN
jgi:hypothetical protein